MINSITITTENDKTKKSVIKQRNLGIELLRAFLCFRIIILHYYSSTNNYILSLKSNRFQVPCFFFISFYFLYPTIYQRNEIKLKMRLERLLVPYIGHPIINWIINNLMFSLIGFNRYNRYLTLNDLKTQLIVGRGIYGIAVLWFHFNLLIFTILFFIFSYLMGNYFLVIFQLLAIYSYKLHYSGINYKFFHLYTENIWMSVGNLNETFPIAISAFSFASINFFQIILKQRKRYLFFSFILFYAISNSNIFTYIFGFTTTGVKQNFLSLFLFIFFSLLPLEFLNQIFLLFIKQITKYTQGIYCLHFVFQYYLKIGIDKNGTFIGCVFLYIISYVASLIGFNICSNTKLKFLFS